MHTLQRLLESPPFRSNIGESYERFRTVHDRPCIIICHSADDHCISAPPFKTPDSGNEVVVSIHLSPLPTITKGTKEYGITTTKEGATPCGSLSAYPSKIGSPKKSHYPRPYPPEGERESEEKQFISGIIQGRANRLKKETEDKKIEELFLEGKFTDDIYRQYV